MILLTGGTGFIGNALIRHLTDLGYPVKLLLRPTKDSPNLPKGLPLDITVTSLNDEKGLRAALRGVSVVFHLATAEALGRKAKLTEVDIEGTKALLEAANQAKIDRLIYLSHLGADQASAYPLLKAKGVAEQSIKNSGVPYTIFRSGLTYGERDHFTNSLAFLIKVSPYFVMLPEDGGSLLQPIWVEDLCAVLTGSLEIDQTINSTIEIGGPEYLSFREISEIIADRIGARRQFINVSPVFLNILTELIEIIIPNFPTSVFWLDYLAANRTAQMDVLPRTFDIIPARLSQRLGYLEGKNFRKNWWRIIQKRKRTMIRWD